MNDMLNIGDRKTVEYEYRRKDCEECGEPATHKLTFLYKDARRNPASSGFGGDDISWCSDANKFSCDVHKEDMIWHPPEGMTWCSDFYVSKQEDGTLKNLDRVCSWEQVRS